MNHNKRFYSILLIIMLLIMIIYSAIMVNKVIPVTSFGEELSSAKAMCVLEANSNRILLSKNQESILPMASTTKIMTALVAIENCKNFDEIIEIDKRAIGVEGTSIYLTEHEHLTIKELLYGLMLASGNDASVALASFFGDKNINKFVDMMNEKAKEIGAVNTHFVNPHGLDAENHYTTAYDLALITAEAIKNPIFREIVSTKKITISGNDKVEARYLKNKERLLNTYDNCIGVKTGFTDNAGRCNVSAVEKNGMTMVCVVLNCPDMFEESERLLNIAFENFSMVNLIKKGDLLGSINIKNGKIEKIDVFSEKEFNYPLTETEKSFIIINSDLEDNIEAPVKSGFKVGTLTITLNNNIIYDCPVYIYQDISSNIENKKIENEIEKILDNWTY